jgi:hypothetical protein
MLPVTTEPISVAAMPARPSASRAALMPRSVGEM